MKVTAVVPAYNEEQGIEAVLGVLASCPDLSEIIVVSDGSTDRTFEIAAACPFVRAMDLHENVGKGGAMVAGAEATDAEVVAFIDADLVNLQPRHVTALIRPVVTGEADVAIGLFRGGKFLPTLSQRITPQVSGQRAYRREAFLAVPDLTDSKFGVEMALTRYAHEQGLREVEVIFDGVTHTMKEQKRGLFVGVRDRLAMYGQIVGYLLLSAARRIRGVHRREPQGDKP